MSVHNHHPVKLGDLLSLNTAHGPFQLHKALLHIQYFSGSETEVELRLTFEGTQSTWEQIQMQQLFGVKTENIGPIWGGAFKPERPLVFELLQRTTSTTFIGIMTEHPLDAAIKIIESPMEAELRQAANYQLVAVKQALLPNVYTGLMVHHPELEVYDDYAIDSPDSIPQNSDIQSVQDDLLADVEAALKKPKPTS